MPRIIQRTLSIPSDSRYLEDLRQFAGEALAEAAIAQRSRRPLLQAVDEVVTTWITYAEETGYTSEITVTIDIDDVRFKAILSDTATAFEAPAVDAATTPKRGPARFSRERRNGLALPMLGQLLDEVGYSYQKGFENKLELLKFL